MGNVGSVEKQHRYLFDALGIKACAKKSVCMCVCTRTAWTLWQAGIIPPMFTGYNDLHTHTTHTHTEQHWGDEILGSIIVLQSSVIESAHTYIHTRTRATAEALYTCGPSNTSISVITRWPKTCHAVSGVASTSIAAFALFCLRFCASHLLAR